MEAAASIIGLVAIGLKVYVTLESFVSTCKDAPEIAKITRDEVRDFWYALHRLRPYVERTAQITRLGAAATDTAQLSLTLGSCMVTFSEVEKLLDRLLPKPEMNYIGRIRWTVSGAGLTQLIKRIQQHKITLNLLLTIWMSESSAQTEQAIDVLNDLLRDLLDSRGQPATPDPAAQLEALTSLHDTDTSIPMNGPRISLSDDNTSILTTSTSLTTQSKHSFKSLLLKTKLYSNPKLFENSGFSISTSRRRGTPWSEFTVGSNTSVFSLPFTDFQWSGLSIAEEGDVSQINVPVDQRHLYRPRWYPNLRPLPTPSSTSYIRNQRIRRFSKESSRPVSIPPRPELEEDSFDLIDTNDMEEVSELILAGGDFDGDFFYYVVNKSAILAEMILDRAFGQSLQPTVVHPLLDAAIRARHWELIDVLFRRKQIPETGSVDSNWRQITLQHAAESIHVSRALCKGPMPAASLRSAIVADDSDDLAPLAFAVMKGNMNMVRFLLTAGCSVSLTENNGSNALLYATMLGDVRAIQFILDNSGPNLQSEAKDGIGETALHKALIDHELLSRGIPSLLIERGANVNATTQDGTTPLMICLRRIGKQSRTDALAAATPGRYTALHSSCTALLRIMVAWGADIYARGPQGITPLIQAIHCHDAQLDPMLVRVRFLIDAGASLFDEDHGYIALNHAAEKGDLDLLRLLLMNGANYNLVKRFCRTALYPALVNNSIELVRLLLDLGAHIGNRTADGIAPLHYFILHHDHSGYLVANSCHSDEEHSKMFNLLLDYGGDVSEIVPRGKSVLHHLFYSTSYFAVVTVLVNRGFSLAVGTTNKGSILTDAIIFPDPPSHLHQDVLAYVLENAPPHSVTQDHLNSALLYVKSKGYFELMRLLLEKGADPNSTSASSVNMLDKAGNPKIPQQPDSSSMNPEPMDIYPPDPETTSATSFSLDAPRVGCVVSGRAELEA